MPFQINKKNIKNIEIKNNRIKREYNNYIIIGINKNNDIIEGTISECLIKLKEKLIQYSNKDKSNLIVTPSSLYKCAIGYYPKYYGYKWVFKDKDIENFRSIFTSPEAADNLLSINSFHKKRLVAYENGMPIIGLNDVVDAMKWLKDKNIDPDYRSIVSVARYAAKNMKRPQTSCGYGWRFYDDVNLKQEEGANWNKKKALIETRRRR